MNPALKYLSIRKVSNALQLWASYQLSRKLGKNLHKGLPVALSVEPTTACNLRCPECPSGLRNFTRPTGKLSLDLFEKLLKETSPYLGYLLLYFQGEPYLHPQFCQMVALADKYGIFTATSTNAHFLTSEKARETVSSGLQRIIISIDGVDQESYQSYRKEGKLEKVIEGTENILYWKKKLKRKSPEVVFQFLVVKPNEHQIPEVYKLAKKLGVDRVVLKTAQIYDYENGSPLIPEQGKYSRYQKLPNGKYQIKNNLENGCWKMWHSAVITWDGQVVPCCFDKDATHSMGSLQTQSFQEIWQSEKYNQFRKQLLHSRSNIEICRNCTEGMKVLQD